MLFSFAESHIGQRKVNEDSYLVDEELGLFIVADGVGGLDKGEIASRLVCKVIHENIKFGLTLEESVYKAHRALINEIKSNENKKGMATTVVAALFNENSYDICWVGDSRAYLWHDDLKLITRDDSYVELLLENGHIALAELETHPDRNVISQALGIERKNIIINHNSGTLCGNQILMICSDGLYTVTRELDIINTLTHTNDVQEISTKLVASAVAKDGKDNITLITIASNENIACEHTMIQPKIYREYEPLSGKVLGMEDSDEFSDMEDLDSQNLDPELVDQTQLKELTPEELSLINSATKQNPTMNKKISRYVFPVILVSILALIGALILR